MRCRRFVERLFWLFAGVLVGLVGLADLTATRVDDDTLYLAYLASPPSVQAKQVEHELTQRLSSRPTCELASFRLNLRDRYAKNYAGYSAVGFAAGRLTHLAAAAPARAIISEIITTKSLLFVACVGMLLFAAFKTRERAVKWALGSAIMTLAILAAAANSGLIRTFWIINSSEPLKAIAELAYSFIITDRSQSIFGLTPRNIALILFALAMVLRWQGRALAAAAVVLAICAVHQTYAGLALLMYCASAAVSNPSALRPAPARALLLTCLAVYVLRENFQNVDIGPRLIALVGAVGAGAGMMAFAGSQRFSRVQAHLPSPLRDRPVIIDAAVMLAISFVVTMIALVAAVPAHPIQKMYLWGDLATRVWSFARFPAFVALALIMYDQWSSFRAGMRLALMLLGVMAGSAALIQFKPSAVARMSSDYEALMTKPIAGKLTFPTHEAWLYGHLAAMSRGQGAALELKELSTRGIGCVDWMSRH